MLKLLTGFEVFEVFEGAVFCSIVAISLFNFWRSEYNLKITPAQSRYRNKPATKAPMTAPEIKELELALVCVV